MNEAHLLSQARAQLDLVLSFFARAETKASALFGIDVAMAGVVAATVPVMGEWNRDLIAAALATVLIGCSISQLYLASAPQLSGGEGSLVYFRSAAGRSEADYVTAFSAQTIPELSQDLLQQTWRNASILTKKFDHLDRAFRWTALAVLPWFSWIVLRATG